MLTTTPLPSRRRRLLAVRLFGACLLAFAQPLTARAGELRAVRGERLPPVVEPPFSEWLAAHRGRALLINFWASWCPPCRDEMPELQALSERYREHGLLVATVAVADRIADARRFLADLDLHLPLLEDRTQTISRAWGVRVLPGTLVLDRRHRLRLRAQGLVDWQSPAVDRQLQALLKPLK